MALNKKGYLGAGTGATIIGSLIPLLLTLFFTILAFLVKYFWKPIKKFFKRKKA